MPNQNEKIKIQVKQSKTTQTIKVIKSERILINTGIISDVLDENSRIKKIPQSLNSATANHNLNLEAHSNLILPISEAIAKLAEQKSDKSEIPTSVSQLENDSNFATVEQLSLFPSVLSGFKNDCDFVSSTVLNQSLLTKSNLDMNNITQTGKENMVSWGMPDYSRGISKNVGSFTATQSGFVFFLYEGSRSFQVFVNNILLSDISQTYTSGRASACIPLNNGDVINTTNDGNYAKFTATFYPLKGV